MKHILEKKTTEAMALSMYWDGIIGHHKTPPIYLQGRITAETYIRDVLEEHVMPFFLEKPNYIFMQDNAPTHRALLTKDY